jgi:hypothetical protein
MRYFSFVLGSFLFLTGCPDGKGNAPDAGSTAIVDAGPPIKEKKLDAERCDAGASDLEAIAKAAKKSCSSNADCTEWIRKGNCGSVAVARPFPPADADARWKTAQESVNVACPDEPKCKWASMGVECRGGQCQPSLDGTLVEPTP